MWKFLAGILLAVVVAVFLFYVWNIVSAPRM